MSTRSAKLLDQRSHLLREGAPAGRLTRVAISMGLVAVIGGCLAGYSAFTASRRALYDSISRSNLLVARDIAQHLRDGQFDAFTPEALRAIEHEWFNLRQDSDRYCICVVDRNGRLVLHTSRPELVGTNVRGRRLGRDETGAPPRTVNDLLGTDGEWAGLNEDVEGRPQIVAYVGVPEIGGLLVVHAMQTVLDEIVQQTMLPWWFALAALTLVLVPLAMMLLRHAYRTAQRRSEDAIDQLCRSLEFQQLLLRELDHRVRNNLAALKSLVDISRSNHADVATYSSVIKGRIQAMAEVHTLLSDSRWTSVNLPSLIERLVPEAHRDAVRHDGPDVLIPARQAGAAGMVLHELITNSIKHGSLAAPEGHIRIAWSVESAPDDDPDSPTAVHLAWLETNGPTLDHSPGSGIGSGLVRGLVETELRGCARLNFPRDGASHELTMRLDSEAETRSDTLTPPPGAVSLQSPLI